jgi:hypothetical protein
MLVLPGAATVGSFAGPKTFTPAPVAVLTQRYDNKRTGANTQEHALTVTAVASQEFQKLYTVPVTGQVYAQPLLVPQVPMPDGSAKNILVVATMMNIVQAFQVDDAIYGPAFAPVPLWNVSVGTPVPGNFMAMAYSMCTNLLLVCLPNTGVPSFIPALPPIPSTADDIVFRGLGLYNINPLIGILSTPVIDPASRTVFVVPKVSAPAGTETHLVAIDLVTGQIKGTAVVGDGAQVAASSSDSVNGMLTFDQTHHMQRPALLLQNQKIYIALGSHQDTLPWHGWVFAYDPGTLKLISVWCSTPNSMGGAVWQAGNGLAGGDDGNVYVMTGNGKTVNGTDDSSNSANANFANMFVQLSPTLAPLGHFAPGDTASRDSLDLDLGSSGPVLLPGTTILIGGDKESRLFVLDTSTGLGMRQNFQAGQQLDSVSVGGTGYHHLHGAPAVWRSSDHGLTAYFWAERDYLRALRFDDAKALFDCSADPKGCEGGATTTPDQHSSVTSPLCFSCMPGGIISVSADGVTPGTGIVWATEPFNTQGDLANSPVGGGLNNVVAGVLHAFDAENIANDLWNSELQSTRDGSFLFAKFAPAMVANGRVYVATASNVVNVYGLRQWAKFLNYSLPPPASVTAGTPFTVKAVYLNDGTTTWHKGTYQLVSKLDSDLFWGSDSVDLPNDAMPGDELTITLSLKAPSQVSASDKCASVANGVSCNFAWQMNQHNVESFGDVTPVGIIKIVGASKPPPTPTCPVNRKSQHGVCCEINTAGKCNVCAYPPKSCP